MRAPVCVHHSKRNLIEFGDYVFCYFMNDRAAPRPYVDHHHSDPNQRQAQQVSPAMVSRCAPTPTG
jgi:hypothetical protein